MAEVRLRKYVVDVEECGHLDVYVQGDLESGKNSGSILLTLHGVGQSYKDWVQFMGHEDMVDTVARSLVLHVCLPGQDEEAEDLPGQFPDLSTLGMNLVTVLDHLRISRVVVLGAGAGANIAARFAMNHPGRVQGMLLVDCKHAVASFPLKLKVLRNTKWSDDLNLNTSNVAKYEEAYKKRDEILTDMSQRVAVDTLLICGAKAQMARAAEDMHANIAIGLCSIIKLDDVTDVVVEAPERLADSLILFCQGLGLVPSVQRKISRSQSVVSETSSEEQDVTKKTRKVSMEMFDIPNIRRLSLSSHNI